MKLGITVNLNEQMFHLVSILLSHRITIANLDLDLDNFNLTKEEEESLQGKLKGLNLNFTQKQQEKPSLGEEDGDASGDEENELNLSNNVTTFAYSRTQPELRDDQITKEITDQYILHYLSSRTQKIGIVGIAEKFKIDLEFSRKSLIICGAKEKVLAVYNQINKTVYETSCVMTATQARCLKATNYVNSLKRTYDVKIRFMLEKNDRARLIIFGNNKLDIRECKEKLNQVGNNLMILSEIDKEHEIEGETDEMLKYLQENYKNKFEIMFRKKGISAEIDKTIHKHANKSIIFFFVKCSIDHWNKIRDYLLKEISALCIVNVYPKPKNKGVLEKLEGSWSQKISLRPLRSGNCLLIGKAKHILTHLQSILNQETSLNVDQFRLRLKKIPKMDIQNFLTDKNAAISAKNDPYYFIFLIYSVNLKYLLNVLGKFAELLKRHEVSQNISIDNSILNISDHGNDYSRFTFDQTRDSEYIEGPFSKKTPTDKILEEVVEEPRDTPIPYLELNLNKSFIQVTDFEEDLYVLSQDSTEFGRIEKLFKKGCPRSNIEYIIKNCNQKLWSKYDNQRYNQKSEEIVEYTLFYNSKNDCEKLASTDVDPEIAVQNFISYYDPIQHICYEDDSMKNVIVFAATFSKIDKKIICCYPAYIVVFN